jgi:DNA-binding Xre family transcriptional regulator
MKEVNLMAITYAPLWDTMKTKGITTYGLKYKLKLGGGTYNRLKNNLSVSTNTINMLCEFLNCEVQDIMCYYDESKIY